MKRIYFIVFNTLIALVLLATVLDWLVHFSEPVNRVIHVVMFTLIGIAYLVMAYALTPVFPRLVIFLCGLLLLVLTFLDKNTWSDITRIGCILVPMLIARFQKEKPAATEPSVKE